MKSLFLLLALVTAAMSFVGAQNSEPAEIRVHVLPVVNRSDQAQFDAVATTVTGTVSLTLRLLGDYEISHGEPEGPSALPADPTAREETLAALAEELSVENLVFGEVLPSEGEELPRIRLGVYDRLSGEITVQEERTPQSLFGVFTVTDELAADVLSGFAGRRVAFGSVRITPEYGGSGEPPPYRVALDGEELGANLRSVDSILTGSHRLTVTTEVLGEERVLLDEEIAIEEGATREVALELPDVDLVAEEQDRARREAEERQRTAIRRLQAERRTYSSTLAAELYLTADEFLDPQLIREEALENARVQAQFELRRGQTMLSDRRWNEGMATHGAIAGLARAFDQDDLFGYGDQIGFATSSYGEILVQEERTPQALLPWVLFGAAFAMTFPTGESPFVEPGPPMAQYVPFFPVVFAGVSTAIWNAGDWDYRPKQRLLRRYGEDGMEAVDRLRPWPKWEVAPGITTAMGPVSAYRITPGPVAQANGVGAVDFFQVSFIPALRIRYWLTPGTAVGGELRVATVWGKHEMGIQSTNYEEQPDGEYYAGLAIEELFATSVDWSHTRTGRAILDAGLTLRLLEFSTDNIRSDSGSGIVEEETYEELLGGPTAFVVVPGIRTGFGLRFGRGELPPWEFALHYRLERTAFPNGVLADEGPYYLHRFDASIRRSVFIGTLGDDDEATDQPTTSVEGGRARAEERWTPHPLWIYADPGGFLTRGPRLGLEYQLTPRWSVGIHGRWAASLAMAEVLPVDTTLGQPEFAWPGASLRWYQKPQPRSPQEMVAGWYGGAIVEYGRFDLPVIEGIRPEDEDEFVSNQGSLWFVLAEGGYRLSLGRSGFLDLGVQAGARLGEGYESERYRVLPDGSTETHTSTSMGAGTWLYPTISLGTRLY